MTLRPIRLAFVPGELVTPSSWIDKSDSVPLLNAPGAHSVVNFDVVGKLSYGKTAVAVAYDAFTAMVLIVGPEGWGWASCTLLVHVDNE